MKLETRAVRAGRGVDPATGAVNTPIYMSTNFERSIDGDYPHGYFYSVFGNPNRTMLESAIAGLEDGDAACAFSSGSAAAMAVLQSLPQGSHVVCGFDVFQGTARLLQEHAPRLGISASFVDMTDVAAIRAALRSETRLLWLESPSNPLLRISDVAAICSLARDAGILTAIDNSWSTPTGMQPRDFGVDLVVYSTSKFLGGHSDVVGGVVVRHGERSDWQSICDYLGHIGAVPSPFDCWLLLRGLKTLPWRMAAHSANAMRVATFLHDDARVAHVNYPGLESHAGHDVAKRQMREFGGMISFEPHGGRDGAIAVTNAVSLWTRATSFGTPESVIEHRASSPIQTIGKGSGVPLPDGLIRLSVGLENADDLIADLDRALEVVRHSS